MSFSADKEFRAMSTVIAVFKSVNSVKRQKPGTDSLQGGCGSGSFRRIESA